MAKAGSTSIQSTLRDERAYLLSQYGIWTGFSGSEFASDHYLLDAVENRLTGAVDGYIDALCGGCREYKVETLIISSEMFISQSLQNDCYHYMLQILRDRFNEFRLIIVARNLRGLLKSQLIQFIANGHVPDMDVRLADWFVSQVQANWDLPYRVSSISFDKAVGEGALVRRFLSLASNRDVVVPERYENATNPRPLLFEAVRGFACRFRSLARGEHINGVAVDALRTAIAERYDLGFCHLEHRDEVDIWLREVSDLLESEMDALIEASISRLPSSKLEFYNGLVASPNGDNGK
jgi:hypothetical protein